MKALFYLALSFIILFINENAIGQITFQKTFETPISISAGNFIIRHTQDNGYILLSSQYGFSDIVKTDSLGNKTWSKKIDYGHWYVKSNGISQTNDGGYILSGRADGSIGGGFLIKLNSTGNIVWQKTFCFSNDFNHVKDDIDGTGYIAEGKVDGYGLVFMKVDFSGNIIWNVTMHPSTAPDEPHSGGFMQLQSDSSFITLSTTGNGVVDALLCSKFSKTGNNIWVKSISLNGINPTYYNWLSLKKTYNGNVMISYQPGAFIELDTSGNPVSAMNCLGVIWDFANPAIDKSMFISDYVQNPNGTTDIRLIKTNASGNIEWSRRIGGANVEGSADITNDGKNGCAALGITKSFSASSNGAMYLIKTDSTGTLSCNADTLPFPTVTFLTASTTNFSCVFTSPSCNSNSIGFTASNPNDTSYDACGCVPPVANFYTGYPGPNGGAIQDNSTWATTWFWDYGNGQTDSSVIPAPNYSVDGLYYVCLTVTNACGTDSFCDSLNYVYMPVGIENSYSNSITQIYPNPSAGNFIISFERTIAKGNVEILNILGERVFAMDISNESKKEINLKNISDGIYFVKVYDGEKYYCRKIIVEQE